MECSNHLCGCLVTRNLLVCANPNTFVTFYGVKVLSRWGGDVSVDEVYTTAARHLLLELAVRHGLVVGRHCDLC
jgi:hypothetical protein